MGALTPAPGPYDGRPGQRTSRGRRRSPAVRSATLAGLALAVLVTASCAPSGPDGPDASSGPSPDPTSPTSQEASVTPTPEQSARPEPRGDRRDDRRGDRAGADQPDLPADLDAALRQAAWDDDVEEARRLVRAGADVNAKDDTEQSAYLIATSEGYWRLLDLTLRHGAKVDDKDSFNGTGLIRAAERGHALVVGMLLQAGIDRDHVNNLGWQAIHEAVWLGEDTQEYVDTVRVLAAGGVELDRPSVGQGLTPRHMATERGFDRLGSTLDRITGADVSRGEADATLLRAATTGDPDLAAAALRAGADLEARDERRRTPLLLAVTHDRVDVIRLLVALGADPDALDVQHDTPWLVTGVTGSVAALEALLPAGPDMTIRNRYGGVSVIPASERGHVDYVRRVVRTPIDVDHVNDLGWTALLEAVILGDGGPAHQEVVRVLLDAGADRSIPDKDGVTALEHAEQRGYDEIARLLRR